MLAETQISAPLGEVAPKPLPVPATNNNFNLLRLTFALMVAAYHLVFLPNVDAWKPLVAPMSLLAEIGVQGFFVLSGYLVFASLERSPSLTVYIEKRVRRLYPAYLTVVLFCATLGLAMVPEARADLAAVIRYLGSNLLFLNFLAPGLPGVFTANPVSEVNGALWTLKIEVLFYILLPVLAWLFQRTGWFRFVLLAGIYGGAEAWRYWLHKAGLHTPAIDDLAHQLPGQMSFFAVGIALRMLNLQGWKVWTIGVVGAALLAASIFVPDATPARALGLGAAAICLATGLPRVIDVAKFGDLSYGLYITHFPVIQAVIALGLFATPWVGASFAVAGAFGAAVLLWRLIEKPALRADSAYRKRS